VPARAGTVHRPIYRMRRIRQAAHHARSWCLSQAPAPSARTSAGPLRRGSLCKAASSLAGYLTEAQPTQRRAPLGPLGLCQVVLHVDLLAPHRAYRLVSPADARAFCQRRYRAWRGAWRVRPTRQIGLWATPVSRRLCCSRSLPSGMPMTRMSASCVCCLAARARLRCISPWRAQPGAVQSSTVWNI